MKTPRLSGRALIAARIAAESPGTGRAIFEVFRRALGIEQLALLPHSLRADLPLDSKPRPGRAPRNRASLGLTALAPAAWPRTCRSYVEAFSGGVVTPRIVAERLIDAVRALPSRRPTMNIATDLDVQRTLREADAASARYAAGRPRGALDGVPMLVKDEFDVLGLPTWLGSRCEDPSAAAADSTVVARLSAAGAIFAAKTVLTEWGMSPLGCNRKFEMPHNVFDSSRAPGGSSTGTGVGIALGIAPVGAGGDGGGSIRIPASLNGIFGIKPTFGRVSRAGDLFKGSVAHAGPLGSSTDDLVAFLDATAQTQDDLDDLTAWAPAAPTGGFGSQVAAGVKNLRIGVPEAEWALADPEVAAAGKIALKTLERDGATLVPIDIPLARRAAAIGYLVIGPESLAHNLHHVRERRDRISDDLRISFAVLGQFSAADQLDAQRLRSALRNQVAASLQEVDVIALPTTAITAPRYTESDALEDFIDPDALDALCRFAFLGNLTGLPAGTAPVGFDRAGLPIGLQIVGDAWDEPTVLAVLAHLERTGAAQVKRPPGGIDLLGG